MGDPKLKLMLVLLLVGGQPSDQLLKSTRMVTQLEEFHDHVIEHSELRQIDIPIEVELR